MLRDTIKLKDPKPFVLQINKLVDYFATIYLQYKWLLCRHSLLNIYGNLGCFEYLPNG